MTTLTPAHEPHKIKTVRLLAFPTLEERRKYLADARFNVFHLTPRQVTFDMCSNAINAVSQEQLAGQLVGDEAYAGSRNFDSLRKAVRGVLGHHYVCPAHNSQGAVKLVFSTLLRPGAVLPSNARSRTDVLTPRDVDVPDMRDRDADPFTGNMDLARLEQTLQEADVAIVGLQAFADGQHPVSMENLRGTRALAHKDGKHLICDGSRIVENAWFIQRHEPGYADRPIKRIVREFAKTTDILHVDGAQDPKCNTGGILTTDKPELQEKFMNEVVVFEGLHTYGGMAGRTMEVLARGLAEMCDEAEVHWVMSQTQRFTRRLRDAGVPLERGCDGAYIDTAAFLPHISEFQQDAFCGALYAMSGVRAIANGFVLPERPVPVQIPRLAMTNEQLDQVADAIISLYEQRDKVPPLNAVKTGRWRDQMEYHGVFADLEPFEFDTAPYEIHTFERVGVLSRERRERAMREAGFNTFLLRSEDVTIDLLTDSGTSAMSTDQWAAYEGVRPSATTSEAYLDLVATLKDIIGYEYILPTHQGRAAEHILSEIMIKPGQIVPGNMYFTTTKLHQELAGGVFADVIVDEAHDPTSEFPWKGNIDLAKLDALVQEHGAGQIAYVSFEHSVNMAGGQPCSMDNMREVYAYCSKAQIPVFFDSTRFVENACMIQARDPRYKNTSVKDILREMMIYGDGCTVSGKKDFLINIGGVLCFRENERWAREAEEKLRVYEGNVTDGGLATADLAVPIVTPPGSHAIFLDAKRFLPHVDQDAYPAQRLAAEIYIETGVRAMERGNVSKGRNPETGENYRPALELVRLTIPRRVYSNDHIAEVARGIIRVWGRRESIQGLRFVYEPEKLRFFQGRFESL